MAGHQGRDPNHFKKRCVAIEELKTKKVGILSGSFNIAKLFAFVSYDKKLRIHSFNCSIHRPSPCEVCSTTFKEDIGTVAADRYQSYFTSVSWQTQVIGKDNRTPSYSPPNQEFTLATTSTSGHLSIWRLKTNGPSTSHSRGELSLKKCKKFENKDFSVEWNPYVAENPPLLVKPVSSRTDIRHHLKFLTRNKTTKETFREVLYDGRWLVLDIPVETKGQIIDAHWTGKKHFVVVSQRDIQLFNRKEKPNHTVAWELIQKVSWPTIPLASLVLPMNGNSNYLLLASHRRSFAAVIVDNSRAGEQWFCSGLVQPQAEISAISCAKHEGEMPVWALADVNGGVFATESNSTDRYTALHDISNNRKAICCLALSPDGVYVAVANVIGELEVYQRDAQMALEIEWPDTNWLEKKEKRNDMYPVQKLVWSLDSHILVACTLQGLWLLPLFNEKSRERNRSPSRD